MTFVRFTGSNGRLVSVKSDQVASLHEPLPGEMSPNAKTVIVYTNGQFQAVKEPMDVVEAKLG